MAERWLPDHILPRFYKTMESLGRLENALIRNGWFVKMTRSNITRGWTYNSDMYRIVPTGRFHTDEPKTEIKQFVPHGAGSGLNPSLALLDAARLTNVKTADLLLAIMECEAEYLLHVYREAREREARQARAEAVDADLAEALDALTALLRSSNVPVTPDEDDDL